MGRKNSKPKKGGISLVKKKNIKGGKLSSGKKTKNKEIVLARRKLQTAVRKKLQNKNSGGATKHAEINMEDVLDMIDDEELMHLKGEQFKDRQYLVNSEAIKHNRKSDVKRKKPHDNDEEDLENVYENKLRRVEESEKRYKMLLPIKNRTGLHLQVTEEEEDVDEIIENGHANVQQKETQQTPPDEAEDPLKDVVFSLGKLVAQRRAALLQYKLRIGTLSAGFLEDPNNRMRNLDALLMIMDGNDPAVSYTVPKLCALSLLAVFQDVLPAYAIKHFNDGVKLKKDTLQLQNHESSLVSKYKMYLKKLENIATQYCPKRKPRVPFSDAESSLGMIALECMCGMLLSHPYFNMSNNLVNFLIPYLNNWNPSVRVFVFNAIKSVFRMDKRGEISYEIIRRINDLVKSKLAGKGSRVVHQEVLNVLLALRIKEADLQKEKEDETSSKSKMTFEQRKMLSKRNRKKAKELVLLEKELLEASAEENKEQKSHFLTEITKLVFTIYFRALKNESNYKILSCVLEGLSKFAHVINVDFFDDILKVLERLLNEGHLKHRQILLCISTVLAVLDGQGAALTLDPTSFHKHLYAAIGILRCGKVESDVGLALRCIRLSLGTRKMPGPRAIAFAKRLTTTSLQVEYQDALGILVEMKQILRLHPSVGVLLDCDGCGASGVYLPELEDPDHSCANAATMWELTSLMAHYHPWVSQMAKTFVSANEKMPVNLINLLPEAICAKYDTTTSAAEFHPALPEKSAIPRKIKNRQMHFTPKTEALRDAFEKRSIESFMNEDNLDSINFNL